MRKNKNVFEKENKTTSAYRLLGFNKARKHERSERLGILVPSPFLFRVVSPAAAVLKSEKTLGTKVGPCKMAAVAAVLVFRPYKYPSHSNPTVNADHFDSVLSPNHYFQCITLIIIV